MPDNNKFSIDVEIGNGQNQINQYAQAFEGLRQSINGLSNPLNSLSSNLSKTTDSLAKLNLQNQELASSGDKATNKISDLSTSFVTWSEVIRVVQQGLKSWTLALTGGLTIIAAFAPEIINFVTSLLKGKDAIDKAKLSIDAMNKALQSSDYSNAVKQVKELSINVTLAKKGFIDKQEVLQQYNNTVGKTMGQVSSLQELEDMLVKKGPVYIKITLLKAKAQSALQDATKKAIEIEQLQNTSNEDSANFLDKLSAGFKEFFSSSEFDDETTARYEQNIKNAGAKRRAALLSDATKTKDALTADALKYQTEAAQLAKINGADLFGDKTNKNTSAKYLQAMSDNVALKIDVDKKYYEAELAAFTQQLSKKQITQDEYFNASTQLQEKYYGNLRATIKNFNDQDLDQTLQHQKELVEAQQLNKDEQKINKAISPASKLAAEKQLITDKYNFEIQAAADAGKDTAAIREQYQQEITAADKRHVQERKDFETQTAQNVSNAAFSILQNSIKARSDAKIKQLETQKTAELSNSSLTASQKQAIEDKYKKKEADEKTKAFKAEQRASILQAVINGALAITKVTSQAGILGAFVIPGIIAETAIQVATIAAQKTPQYAKGGLHYQSDGKGALLSGYSRTDNTNAYLRSGEAVVVSEAMRNPWARNLVSAINVAHGGRDFSVANPGRGYAIGGIFTDGGNSNRYYNQPMNDQKDLANTIAYQMINNFPPVYVDVKDINNQQNILAQTVNRVNL